MNLITLMSKTCNLNKVVHGICKYGQRQDEKGVKDLTEEFSLNPPQVRRRQDF